MSMYFNATNSLLAGRHHLLARRPQYNSWQALLGRWRRWTERSRQWVALRELANDQHLLDDLGLTRQEVLEDPRSGVDRLRRALCLRPGNGEARQTLGTVCQLIARKRR
jgi:uncharacterized protein YjiS (DUF1127 family)